MDTTISEDSIRQNWETYKNDILPKSKKYISLWNDWYKKFNIDKNDVYVRILKDFIINNNFPDTRNVNNIVCIEKCNDNTLIFKGLEGDSRKALHLLCDKIGLHHESKPAQTKRKKYRRFLYIYKPATWLWEYTERNPFSENDEVYKEIEKERDKVREKEKERMSRKHCCECGENGWNTELFHSVYISGIYCQTCLDEVSDCEGGILNDHKFEPLL